jgi:hypothetical protein
MRCAPLSQRSTSARARRIGFALHDSGTAGWLVTVRKHQRSAAKAQGHHEVNRWGSQCSGMCSCVHSPGVPHGGDSRGRAAGFCSAACSQFNTSARISMSMSRARKTRITTRIMRSHPTSRERFCCRAALELPPCGAGSGLWLARSGTAAFNVIALKRR